MRKCIKLRNISDLEYRNRNFPAGTLVFVRAICRRGGIPGKADGYHNIN
jgi:hypothetical protein